MLDKAHMKLFFPILILISSLTTKNDESHKKICYYYHYYLIIRHYLKNIHEGIMYFWKIKRIFELFMIPLNINFETAFLEENLTQAKAK